MSEMLDKWKIGGADAGKLTSEAECAVLGEQLNHEYNLRNQQTNVLIAEQITNPISAVTDLTVTGPNQSTLPLSPD
eukprot:3190660-Rhodomonas_salina.1